jgi:hypothetical protein
MAEDKRPPASRPFNVRELWRLGLWGIGAASALGVALLVASSETREDRLRGQVATAQPVPAAPAAKADDGETRRLSEAVQKLASDRDRVLARLDRVELNLADVTGSISRVSEKLAAAVPVAPPAATLPPAAPAERVPVQPPAQPPVAAEASPPVSSNAQASFIAPPATPPGQSPPSAVPPTYVLLEPALGFNRPPAAGVATDIWSKIPVPQTAPSRPAHAAAQASEPAAEPTGSVTEYGVDLGSAPTIEGLRALWTAAAAKYGNALASLRPIAQMRDGARSGSVELRLVAGPLSTAANAARLCAMLAVNGAICQPAVFKGQRLALR